MPNKHHCKTIYCKVCARREALKDQKRPFIIAKILAYNILLSNLLKIHGPGFWCNSRGNLHRDPVYRDLLILLKQKI